MRYCNVCALEGFMEAKPFDCRIPAQTHTLLEGLKGFDWGCLEVQNSVIATQQKVSKQSDHPPHGAH